MTKDEALKLALEALEVANSCIDGYYIPKGKTHLPEIEKAIIAIKEALTNSEKKLAGEGILIGWDTKTDTPIFAKPPQRKPLTDEEERKAFEQWYVCNAFDYERNPIGSRECGLQWSAWKARAAHGIKGEA